MTAEKTVPKCNYCAKQFKYESERKRHEKSHTPQFSCRVCSKNFSFQSALRRHEKQHERTGSVQCDKCNRTFRDQTLLKRHINYAHGATYSCPKCNTTFNSEAALGTHMKSHKTNSERKYRCQFLGCKKAFNFAHHLKHHELAHTNNKQHFCTVCNKGFIQSHHLKAHLKTHNPDLSVYCAVPQCNKKFATEFARKRHLAKHHNKTDSGMSSDSNCASDFSAITDFTFSTLSLDQAIEVTEDTSHKHLTNTINGTEAIQQIIPEDLSVPKTKDETTEFNEISDCKTVIGDCLMNGDENCVCAQIPNKEVNEDFRVAPITTGKSTKLSIDDIKFENPCDRCECFNHCNVKDIINAGSADVMPAIEYDNGAIKIKDTCDIDIPDMIEKAGNPKNDMRFAPYSCKAVLGNCIVSGDGTIDEGCLCARMALGEPATAQEIEDITPYPKDLT